MQKLLSQGQNGICRMRVDARSKSPYCPNNCEPNRGCRDRLEFQMPRHNLSLVMVAMGRPEEHDLCVIGSWH